MFEIHQNIFMAVPFSDRHPGCHNAAARPCQPTDRPALSDPGDYEICGRHVLRGSRGHAHFSKFRWPRPSGSQRQDYFRTYGPVLRAGICGVKYAALKQHPLHWLTRFLEMPFDRAGSRCPHSETPPGGRPLSYFCTPAFVARIVDSKGPRGQEAPSTGRFTN